jgi:hypothetical protein
MIYLRICLDPMLLPLYVVEAVLKTRLFQLICTVEDEHRYSYTRTGRFETEEYMRPILTLYMYHLSRFRIYLVLTSTSNSSTMHKMICCVFCVIP